MGCGWTTHSDDEELHVEGGVGVGESVEVERFHAPGQITDYASSNG